MQTFATLADLKAIEAEMPWADRGQARSMYEYLSRAKADHGKRPAISYQLLSGPTEKNVTLSWADLHAQVTQAANLFRSLGVGEKDVVAFVLPNAVETAVTLLAGAVAGIVNPINPLLEPEKISAILRETNAKVVVTLKAFPKTDLPQKVRGGPVRAERQDGA
jgi:fatty-acyl-CoA synthase